MEPLHVDVRPCSSCPYRCDTPAGVWHPDEYAKLALYDDNGALGIFLCHHTNSSRRDPASVEHGDTVCRGWLTVHAESAAARIAVLAGAVTDEQRYAAVDTPLYRTGREAAEAGLAGVEDPNDAAQRMIDRLVRKGAGRP